MHSIRPIKIAYVTTYDPFDISNWSGLGYYISNSLQRQSLSLKYIGPLREKYSIYFKEKQLLYKYLFRKRYMRERAPIILKNYAKQIYKQLSNMNADIVFSPGTIPIAYLDYPKPIVFWTDANFGGMINYYPSFYNLCEETIKDGHTMESSALNRSRLAIYTSEWAIRTAMHNYDFDYSKVKVVQFGANIECNRDLDDIHEIANSRPIGKCKLLFLGIEWLRKGGPIAIEVADRLNKQGLRTELTIVGCKPFVDSDRYPFVKVVGFISKSLKDGLNQLNRLLGESHFLILPTQAEAYGLVFCEANSFGTPCLATNVGGVPSIITDGLNGKLFPKDGFIENCCNYISEITSKYSRYKELCLSSFNEYQSRLNWKVAGETVKNLLIEII